MKDTIGNKGGFNECTHVNFAARNRGFRDPFVFTDPDFEGTPEIITFEGDTDFYGVLESFMNYDSWLAPRLPEELQFVPTANASRFVKRSIENAVVQFPMETFIVNFLLELPNPRNWRNLLPRLRRWSLEAPAEIYLWWEFGAKPLVRDLKKLISIFDTYRRRLLHLKKVNGRTITVRSHDNNIFHFEGDGTVQDLGPVFGPIEDVWRSRGNQVFRHKMDINMNLHVNYRLEGLDDPLARMDAFAALLGLNNPVGVIWEAIPYSFVVDWFTDVSDWIENNLTFSPFKGEIQVAGADHTVKTDTTLMRLYPTSMQGDWRCSSLERIKCYFRRKGVPPNSAEFDGLSPKQLTLAAALAQTGVSRIRRRRRLRAH